MELDLVTVRDLKVFKDELINELRAVMTTTGPSSTKSWLKGCEVKKMLTLSESKLQKLRIQGLLPSSKIGGVHYYRQADIEKMFVLNFKD